MANNNNRVEFNDAGIRALMNSDFVIKELQKYADKISSDVEDAAANENNGEGWEMETQVRKGSVRPVVYVATITPSAPYEDAVNNHFQKALFKKR